jgi:uncharacterized protein (TIGR00661 family)
MKILYGIQGTGNGHITRARVMAKALQAQNVTVDYVFSGRPKAQYFDMERFGDYRSFQGLTFHFEHGKVNYAKTIGNAKLIQLIKDINRLDVSDYDLVLNDFEPISAWAAKKAGIPVINISHQAVFSYDKVPAKGMNWLNRQILKYFSPADVSLGVHWFHFGQTIIPPFIEREPHHSLPSEEILVYMPFEALDEVSDLLNGHYDHNFIVYHPAIKQDFDTRAIKYRKPSRQGFLRDLEACAGVVANAGFELSSEALCVGKKLLLKPLDGQFEQASNAETLSILGLATVMTGLDDLVLESWLRQEAKAAINYPSDPTPLVEWLLAGDYQHPEVLCKRLWQPIVMPQFAT